MIIATDAEKSLDKIQHPLETLCLLKLEGNFLGHLKVMFENIETTKNLQLTLSSLTKD